MSARNKRATAHAPRSQRTSTRPLPKSRTPIRPVLCCPQTVHAIHSSLWTKGAELKHDVIHLRSLVDVQSKSPYKKKKITLASRDCCRLMMLLRNWSTVCSFSGFQFSRKGHFPACFRCSSLLEKSIKKLNKMRSTNTSPSKL